MTTATHPITVNYAQRSGLLPGSDATQVLLALDQSAAAPGVVGVRGKVRDPGLFRDALLTALQVLGSDLRYKGKDRTAYLAYLAKQGKKATAAIWEAQKAFLDESLQDDQKPAQVLPPLLTVHPDEVSLEVFSRDESAYARLALSSGLFEGRQAAHGTRFVDLSPELVGELDRLRAHQPVVMEAGATLPRPLTGPAAGPAAGLEQHLQVPYAWLRGFLQVQTAATLPATACEFAPIDLYNLLFALRTRKAKKSPRALRFELVPGAPPRMIIEPWEIVLEGHGAPYQGREPKVVRTFGRQRLLSLQRLLPHLQRARALLLGPGLPVFWVLDLPGASLTLSLTGWTESGWSSAAAFDALIPTAGPAEAQRAEAVASLMKARGPLPLAEIVAQLGGSATPLSIEEARAALKLLCLRGAALYDVAAGVYRPRSVLPQALPDEALRYGSPREGQAHRLLADKDQVQLTKLHEIAGEGVEIHGTVNDREARRSYVTRFTLNNEGQVREASCTCPQYRRSALREGPCEHLLALLILQARRRAEAEQLRQTPEGRKLIKAETRTLVRRDEEGGETVYRVSLDQRAVRLVWGARSGEKRQQRLWFDNDREAREAYFARLAALGADGFIDAGQMAG